MHKSRGASRSDWQTPEWILQLVREVIGGPIGLDPCTSPDNPTKAQLFYTPKDDGLSMPWPGPTIFMNPPWSRKQGIDVKPWLKRAKEVRESAIDPMFEMYILVTAAVNARWFHTYLSQADGYFFPRGRVAYDPPDIFEQADAPGFDSVLVYYGEDYGLFRQHFAPHGMVLR